LWLVAWCPGQRKFSDFDIEEYHRLFNQRCCASTSATTTQQATSEDVCKFFFLRLVKVIAAIYTKEAQEVFRCS
jgi:hypothetical protein